MKFMSVRVQTCNGRLDSPSHAESRMPSTLEVERRIAEIEAGRMPLVPVEQAIARARQALG